jgi:hypothetical protein
MRAAALFAIHQINMGIYLSNAKKIVSALSSLKTSGTLLTLGVMSVFVFQKDIKKLSLPRKFFKNYILLKDQIKNYLPQNNFKNKFINNFFFRILGFNKILSLDVSSYQNPDIIYDLNNPKTPEKLKNIADCVVDGSTLEHVFNPLASLSNIDSFLKNNGLVIHILPINNLSEDGFYQFNSNYLDQFYVLNNYKIIFKCYWISDYEKTILKINKKSNKKINVTNLVSNDFYYKDFIKAKAASDTTKLPLQIIFIAQKKKRKFGLRIPFQDRYFKQKKWFMNLKKKYK